MFNIMKTVHTIFTGFNMEYVKIKIKKLIERQFIDDFQ